jgi:hypothetical protein
MKLGLSSDKFDAVLNPDEDVADMSANQSTEDHIQ